MGMAFTSAVGEMPWRKTFSHPTAIAAGSPDDQSLPSKMIEGGREVTLHCEPRDGRPLRYDRSAMASPGPHVPPPLVCQGQAWSTVRTGAGHIVSTAVVAETLEACPGVDEAPVVPVGPPAEPVIAALLESSRLLDLNGVRDHVGLRLPPWSQPRILEQTRALPRLPSGKPDRLACMARLERSR